MVSKTDISFEITITNFATCCRLCLSHQAKLLMNSSYLESAHDISVTEAIETVASIEITQSEKLSNCICELCYARLDDAYCFIRDIRTNNQTMLSYFEDIDDSTAAKLAPDERSVDGTNEAEPDTEEQVNAVDLVLNEIAPAKVKARAKRESNVRTLHKCTTCERTFLRKSNLIDHQRMHEQVKLFKCDYCTKSFVQVGNLRMHMRTHTAEKPYQCQLCSKSFAQSGTLKMHMKGHANIKPHSCETCEKSFLTNSDLVKHKLSHLAQKGFHCVLCIDRFFTQKIHLRNHLQNHHKSEDIQKLLAEGIVTHSGEQE